ncbi:uncharacterized protein FOMMEDRAFT_144548 [Fomitiporia mediterranea MF3/22]|uniref:uncharacterized protein n=1 Tax=Fomitiporia mediterranea (strain MF3/22) TaxID=694068 RepID=UPI00044078FD|nr:uncharacterized protein FOMMEDRAFT_144548 [Fomitiporia mediterranea MF3/22]EJD06550.1 hypothetical protein FOMMEDRAFT_144548 [Fomitiporia mediterranea MF3/22]
MPGTVKTVGKKQPSKATANTIAKTATIASTKRKKSVEDEADNRKMKKTKGKEKVQGQEEEQGSTIKLPLSSQKHESKGEKSGVKEKRRKEEKRADVSKTETAKTKTPVEAKRKATKKISTPSLQTSGSEDDDAEEGVEDEESEGEKSENDQGEDDEGKSESEVEEEWQPLHGFSSGSDSSDEDEDDVDKAPVDVAKLPTVAKDDATVKRKLEKAKKQATADRGVIYLGRIPHGFYEDQMKGYFSQFGDVTRLRLSRNKKTGRSRHYAFIEFSSAAVAQIVAETMDNYLLMGHILRCKVVPKEEVHPALWIGANRKYRKVPMDRIERMQQNKERSDEQKKHVEKRLVKREKQKKRKLQASGIDYDFGAISYSKKVKQTA